jgi:hypothetical protein
MLIAPMPSPAGSNKEKLFILQGGKGALNPRGAYDSRQRLAYDTLGPTPNDNVEQILGWAKENLSPKALHDLSVGLLAASYRAGYPTPGEMSTEGDEPTVAGKSPARLGEDAASTRDLFRRFPEIARIINSKGATPSSVSDDSGALAATFTRFPDLARLGPVEPARRRVPSVDSAAAKSLNERFGLDRIKSA